MALTDKLAAIADAIRSKTGDTAGLTLDQMPAAIAGIQGTVLPENARLYYVGNAVSSCVIFPMETTSSAHGVE